MLSNKSRVLHSPPKYFHRNFCPVKLLRENSDISIPKTKESRYSPQKQQRTRSSILLTKDPSSRAKISDPLYSIKNNSPGLYTLRAVGEKAERTDLADKRHEYKYEGAHVKNCHATQVETK